MTDRILRPAEAADKLRCHRRTLYNWIEAGILAKPLKIGLAITGWRESYLDSFISRSQVIDERPAARETAGLRTADLKGPLLDYWVSQQLESKEQYLYVLGSWGFATYFVGGTSRAYTGRGLGPVVFSPTSRWADGGPLVEKARICLAPVSGEPGDWGAYIKSSGVRADRATALEAAMSAFVQDKCGAEVPTLRMVKHAGLNPHSVHFDGLYIGGGAPPE